MSADEPAFSRPKPTRAYLWVVMRFGGYFCGRGPEGKPRWCSLLREAQRWDSKEAAAKVAAWSGGEAVKVGGGS